MIVNRRRTLTAAALGLYLFCIGFGGGMAAERIRFDRQRAAVLARYEHAVSQWHEFLMRAEAGQ